MNTLSKLIIAFTLFSFTTATNAQDKDTQGKTLNHVLLIQWSPDHDPAVKNEVIELFKGLPVKVEGLESFSIKKVEKSSGNFHNTLIFKFSSEEAMAIYDTHSDHEKVKTLAPKIISGFAEYDYWD